MNAITKTEGGALALPEMSNTKYEFVPGDVIVIAPGRTVKRIRALAAIAIFGVSPGDLGGYVEADCNLQVSGNAWVSGDARVYGDAQVSGDARVYGDAQVSGDASKSPLQVGGLQWQVTITDAHMMIGCQFHSLAAWKSFDDHAIAQMDGRAALRFWRAYKAILLGMAEAEGRSFEDASMSNAAAGVV